MNTVRASTSLVKGLAGAALGYVVGGAVMMGVRAMAGKSLWDYETIIAGGFLFALTGWVLGVGVWRFWAKAWFGRELDEYTITGKQRYFSFDTDHKVIGTQYLVTFIFLFFLAGLFAMLMRLELMNPGRNFMSPATYNTYMSLHGTMMIFVAVAATTGAFGNYILPIMIGADDMAFPKLNALSYWLIPPVVMLLTASFFTGGYDTGWTGYAPLSVTTDMGIIFFNLAFFTLGLSSILGAINLIVTTITMRAKGISWWRLPIFVWAIFITAILGFLFTQFIALAMVMVVLDRVVDTAFFDAARGGAPLLYQHVFWFYSHPAVYIMILPAFGITLELLSHFSRKALFAYRWAVGGMISIASMSAIVWAHHMFTSGMPDALLRPFLATTEIISIPTGLIFLSALGTIWQGRLFLKVPMLFVLAVVFNFLIGGLTGVFLADVPVDIQLQDTYFVVAHFHYVIVGGGIFGLFAAIYYWFPKMTGKLMNERLGRIHFWTMFVGFNVTFLPMFLTGLQGMNRRVADYIGSLGSINLLVSLAGFFLGASFLVFLYNWIMSWRRGPATGPDPWGARSLEWSTPSPPPHGNFAEPPVVTEDPYSYGAVPAEAGGDRS